LNPFGVLGRRQTKIVALAGALTSFVFVLSPVGMTVLVGEIVGKFRGSALKKFLDKLVAMDAVTNSTYIAETLIPLIALGLPLSPMALGPAAPLFNAPPRFTTEPLNNIHTLMPARAIAGYAVLGSTVGVAVAYILSVQRSRTWCVWTLKHVRMEALMSAFSGLAAVLAFSEAGIVGILAAFTTAIFSGLLHRFFNLHLGVLYMSFYAASGVTTVLLPWATDRLQHLGVLVPPRIGR